MTHRITPLSRLHPTTLSPNSLVPSHHILRILASRTPHTLLSPKLPTFRHFHANIALSKHRDDTDDFFNFSEDAALNVEDLVGDFQIPNSVPQRSSANSLALMRQWMKQPLSVQPMEIVENLSDINTIAISDMNAFLRALYSGSQRMAFHHLVTKMTNNKHFDAETIYLAMRDCVQFRRYDQAIDLYEKVYLSRHKKETATMDMVHLAFLAHTRKASNMQKALNFFKSNYRCYMNGNAVDKFPLEERVVLALLLMLNREGNTALEKEVLNHHPLRNASNLGQYFEHKVIKVDSKASPENYAQIMKEFNERFDPSKMKPNAARPILTLDLLRFMLRLHSEPQFILPMAIVDECLRLIRTKDRDIILKFRDNCEALFRGAVAHGRFKEARAFFLPYLAHRPVPHEDYRYKIALESILWWYAMLVRTNPFDANEQQLIRRAVQSSNMTSKMRGEIDALGTTLRTAERVAGAAPTQEKWDKQVGMVEEKLLMVFGLAAQEREEKQKERY